MTAEMLTPEVLERIEAIERDEHSANARRVVRLLSANATPAHVRATIFLFEQLSAPTA